MGVTKTFDDRCSERWQTWLPWARLTSHHLFIDDSARDATVAHFRSLHRSQLLALREKGVAWTAITRYNLDNPLLGEELRTEAVHRGHMGLLHHQGKLKKRIRYDKWNRIRYPKRSAAAAAAPPSALPAFNPTGDAQNERK